MSVIAIVIRLSSRVCVGTVGVVRGPRIPRTAPAPTAFFWPGGGVHTARSVLVPAAADGVSHPSHQHQCQADDEEDDPDDQAKMGVSEGRKEGREEEPEDDEEDSEADHDGYLVDADRVRSIAGSVSEDVI